MQTAPTLFSASSIHLPLCPALFSAGEALVIAFNAERCQLTFKRGSDVICRVTAMLTVTVHGRDAQATSRYSDEVTPPNGGVKQPIHQTATLPATPISLQKRSEEH